MKFILEIRDEAVRAPADVTEVLHQVMMTLMAECDPTDWRPLVRPHQEVIHYREKIVGFWSLP